MATVHEANSNSGASSSRTSLLAASATDAAYGTATPSSPTRPSSRKLLFNATLKMAAIFVLSTAFLGGTLWLALPTLDECVVSQFHSCALVLILNSFPLPEC